MAEAGSSGRTPSPGKRPYSTPCVVIAQENDGYIIGVYGPYETRDEARAAAVKYRNATTQTTPVPLHPTTLLGDWS